MSDFLHDVRSRLLALPARLPAIITAADAAAARSVAAVGGRVRFPSPAQPAFSDEFIARAGGLANWGTGDPAQPASGEPILYAVRSWEEDGEEARQLLPAYREKGWLTILIAPAEGRPGGVPGDCVLDNGAPADVAAGPATFLINLALGWTVLAEYAAALTRRGVRPRVLQSVFLPGAADFNAALAPDAPLPACETAIPAGALGAHYLARLHWLVEQVGGAPIQLALSTAAELIRDHLRAGGRVFSGSFAHALPAEMSYRVRSPFLPLGIPRAADLRARTQPGDLLVFFGYIGLSNRYMDHGAWFRAAGLTLITSFVADPNPDNDAPDALVHIPQSWLPGDAEVPVPFPPGKMCPMSVINQLLLFRMLDERVAQLR